MKFNEKALGEFFNNEVEIKDRIAEVLSNIWPEEYGYHPNWIKEKDFTYEVDDGQVYVDYSESCCGEYSEYQYDFPMRYLYDGSDYLEELKRANEEKKRLKAEKKKKEEEERNAAEARQKIEDEKRERELYLKLKAKYEGK